MSPAPFKALNLPEKSTILRIACCALWLITALAGFDVLLNYQTTSGAIGALPQKMPAGAGFALDGVRDTLVMFVHPRCPCTRASIEELNRLMARSRGQVAARVLFVKPPGFDEEWTHSDLWRNVTAIPGVTAQEDPDGAQAHLFGAETSGYVILFNPHGQLLFNGGITGGRGHEGDNAGESAIASILAGEKADVRETPVYGCSLFGQCTAASAPAAK